MWVYDEDQDLINLETCATITQESAHDPHVGTFMHKIIAIRGGYRRVIFWGHTEEEQERAYNYLIEKICPIDLFHDVSD